MSEPARESASIRRERGPSGPVRSTESGEA